MFDETAHVVDILPPITQWLRLAVDNGTTNPLDALLLGLGVNNGCTRSLSGGGIRSPPRPGDIGLPCVYPGAPVEART